MVQLKSVENERDWGDWNTDQKGVCDLMMRRARDWYKTTKTHSRRLAPLKIKR